MRVATVPPTLILPQRMGRQDCGVDLWQYSEIYQAAIQRTGIEDIKRMTSLRDIDLFTEDSAQGKKAVGWEANCMIALYRTCLPPVDTGEMAKVNVQLHADGISEYLFELKNTEAPSTKLWPSDCLLSPLQEILTVHLVYDFDHYLSKSLDEQKKEVVRTLHQGLLIGAEWGGWDASAFDAAVQCVEERNYEFVERAGAPNTSPDGRVKAQIEFEFNTEEIVLRTIFTDGNGAHIATEELGRLEASRVFLNSALGHTEWVDNSTFRLYSREGSQYLEARLPESVSG